jgi:D-beta-D-heptose 7-phosphate kinase/D-beta-D-heptose 1-phosphate adenosyltransferase
MAKSIGKVKEKTELRKILDGLRKKGKKIVFTNGCFDLIHIGHVRYLERAKRLGDVLVVAINTDSSVRRLKGEGRPIIPQRERAEVLASLASVDYVTSFGEDTPYKLIKLLQPDILVKGGDWKKKDIVGSDIVKKTVSLPYIKGASTSEIIEKIKNL